jgi:hypothetical protein
MNDFRKQITVLQEKKQDKRNGSKGYGYISCCAQKASKEITDQGGLKPISQGLLGVGSQGFSGRKQAYLVELKVKIE